jgi:hypothetical protein
VTAKTKTPDAFGSILAALRAMYEAEIARLADVLRPRIMSGEFSGNTGIDQRTKVRGPDQGDPCHMQLEDELRKTHPWVATPSGARAVLACSTWPDRGSCTRDETGGWTDREIAAECMSHDILAAAASRGWVKPYCDAQPYTLRAA